MRPTPGWKLCTLLLVAAAHAWLGWKLAAFRPDGKIATTHRPAALEEVVTVLNFPPRPEPQRTKRAASPQRPHRRKGSEAQSAPTGARPEPGLAEGLAADQALDLSLPAPPAGAVGFGPRDPFARRAALESRATRFDKAWISQGNLTQIVARRSKIAGVVLGALGALRQPCTEQQRREYDPRCVTDQYQHREGAR
jgi:hypothetical protein